jgi:hypothetical protein
MPSNPRVLIAEGLKHDAKMTGAPWEATGPDNGPDDMDCIVDSHDHLVADTSESREPIADALGIAWMRTNLRAILDGYAAALDEVERDARASADSPRAANDGPHATTVALTPCEDEDLPNVPPGGEHERVLSPQKFVVLHRILTCDMILIRLQIGTVEVPFELDNTDSLQWTYRPRGLDDDLLRNRLVATGAAVATTDSIAVAPGLEVRALLRNESAVPAKPRVALLVYEEI